MIRKYKEKRDNTVEVMQIDLNKRKEIEEFTSGIVQVQLTSKSGIRIPLKEGELLIKDSTGKLDIYNKDVFQEEYELIEEVKGMTKEEAEAKADKGIYPMPPKLIYYKYCPICGKENSIRATERTLINIGCLDDWYPACDGLSKLQQHCLNCKSIFTVDVDVFPQKKKKQGKPNKKDGGYYG